MCAASQDDGNALPPLLAETSIRACAPLVASVVRNDLRPYSSRLPEGVAYPRRDAEAGLRTALFFTRVYGRILRPGLARLAPTTPLGGDALRPYFDRLEVVLDRYIAQAKLMA